MLKSDSLKLNINMMDKNLILKSGQISLIHPKREKSNGGSGGTLRVTKVPDQVRPQETAEQSDQSGVMK